MLRNFDSDCLESVEGDEAVEVIAEMRGRD
jgi:hypothetical protein